jgi:hypothetical protein
LTEGGCAKGKRKRNRNALRDKPRRKLGKMVGTNWRSRPLWTPCSFRVGSPQANVTGFLGKGRSFPRPTTRRPGGERQRSVTRPNKWCGSGKPAAKPSHAPGSKGFGTGCEHSRRMSTVATVSQCGGPPSSGAERAQRSRCNRPVSQPGGEKGDGPSRIERSERKAQG